MTPQNVGNKDFLKGIECLLQTLICLFLYLCNLMVQTFDILPNRIYSLKYQRSTTLSCKDIGIKKSEFVAERKENARLKIL